MSPPIRDGSGNDIGSIRLGDGSEISEVRTGAGDVLFSGSDTIVDDFEDNNLAEYSGDTGVYSVTQTSPVPNGSFRLEKTTGGKGDIRSSSGLNTYPQRGDEFAFQFIPGDSSSQPGFRFFGTSSSSTYELFLNVDKSAFILRDRDGFNTLASTSFTYTVGQEYTITIDTATSNDITVTITDESNGSSTTIYATDATYNSTEIAFADNQGTGSTTGTVFDFLRVTNR